MAIPPPTYLANLRDVRVRAQEIIKRAQRIELALQLVDPGARLTETKRVLAEEAAPQQDDVWNIGDRLAAARASMIALPASLEDSGDLLTSIEVRWSRVLGKWPTALGADPDQAQLLGLKSGLESASSELQALILLVGRATIPYRLERWLQDIRVGGQLDFAATFADELPSPAERRTLLEYLASAPAASNGLIDVAAERVYVISPHRWRQWLSYGFMLTTSLAGGLLLWALCSWGPKWGVAGWPFTQPRLNDLLMAYGAVLAGGVLHILVDALKQSRRAGSSAGLFALEDLWLWGHVRERSIVTAIALLVAVTVGLGAIPGVELGFLSALFAGYSADSIFDLFLRRFETFAGAQTAALQAALTTGANVASRTGDTNG